jgi:hypothetical protein
MLAGSRMGYFQRYIPECRHMQGLRRVTWNNLQVVKKISARAAKTAITRFQ